LIFAAPTPNGQFDTPDQLLPSDRTEPWMILHSNIPRKSEWQKSEEINQT